jgi:hypothetical protein
LFNLPLRTWICNAAAVFSRRRGAVTAQAQAADCSRQTVYDHAHLLEERLRQHDAQLQQVRAENADLRQQLAQAEARAAAALRPSPERLQCLAVTAQAMGISLRQVEELLGKLLPADQVPDHATLGRWTAAAGRQARQVLQELDPLCQPLVQTLCADEIFFGG